MGNDFSQFWANSSHFQDNFSQFQLIPVNFNHPLSYMRPKLFSGPEHAISTLPWSYFHPCWLRIYSGRVVPSAAWPKYSWPIMFPCTVAHCELFLVLITFIDLRTRIRVFGVHLGYAPVLSHDGIAEGSLTWNIREQGVTRANMHGIVLYAIL